MKTMLSCMSLATVLGLTLAGCAIPTDESEPSAVDQDEASLTQSIPFSQFAFGSLSSGGQGAASNADLLEAPNWVLDNGVTATHESDLNSIKQSGKIPYMYFYIAAGQAKKAYGIDDCNVTSFDKSLCKWGGDYISKHVTDVVNGHAQAAKRVQQIMGTSPALIHVEPDWYQYTEATHPAYGNGVAVHPLAPQESGTILNQIVSAIHQNCSSCSVVLDVSPWAANLSSYFSFVTMSQVAYVGLVGKAFPATTGKIDNYTYANISSTTGKKVIANTAHGPGGAPNGYDASWDSLSMIDTMFNAGVGAVIQSNANKTQYQNTIASYKAAHGGTTTTPPPPPPPPPTTGNFQFSVASSINPWWIQVHVTPPSGASVTSVKASVKGTIYNLTLQSWGDWAVSPSSSVPAGTSVAFTATSSNGQQGTFSSQPWPAQ